ncbi:MAG: Crp/Fnr family transcriptional regulator, partial [Rhodocyclaceae bacterium]
MNDLACNGLLAVLNAAGGDLPAYLPPELRAGAKSVELRQGDYLFRHGDPVQHLYFIVEGELRLVEYAASGAECVLQRAANGEWLAECSNCMSIYSCYAYAARRSRVAGLPMPLFNRLLHEDASFASAWAAQLAVSLRRLFGRYERRSLKTARERVLHFLITESRGAGQIDLAHSFAALAGELGLSRESLYRTLARLEREGAIRRAGK